MTRPLRIVYKDAWYHVMNRGRSGETIFRDKRGYCTFIDLLREAVDMWKVRVAAYCLMTNHYHLLIQTPEANISRCMRHINGVYTQRYNRWYNSDGQLFRGRFKSILVQSDRYLLELVRYIHRNPLRAALAESLAQYPWMSHHGYLSQTKDWGWLDKDFVLSMLSDDRDKALKAYKEFVSKEDSEEIQKIFLKEKLPSILGTKDFVMRAKKKHGFGIFVREVPDSRIFAPTFREIASIVSGAYSVRAEDIQKSQRGRSNEARNVAIYLMRRHTGATLVKIGESFNMPNYSSVSTVIFRVKEQIAADDKMREKVQVIEVQLKMSQEQT